MCRGCQIEKEVIHILDFWAVPTSNPFPVSYLLLDTKLNSITERTIG